jgi:pSer/pThr/pTyr-binding forkhead associated (FHA) protein
MSMRSIQPAKPHKDHFLIIEDDKGRQEILLDDSRYSIGRDQHSDIRLHSQFVSRRHATLNRLLRDNGEICYQIIDGDGNGKKSSNGILVNGHKTDQHELKHGDEIVFGPQVFAIYQHRQKDVFPSTPTDPFDITLIDPAMMEDD